MKKIYVVLALVLIVGFGCSTKPGSEDAIGKGAAIVNQKEDVKYVGINIESAKIYLNPSDKSELVTMPEKEMSSNLKVKLTIGIRYQCLLGNIDI